VEGGLPGSKAVKDCLFCAKTVVASPENRRQVLGLDRIHKARRVRWCRTRRGAREKESDVGRKQDIWWGSTCPCDFTKQPRRPLVQLGFNAF